jgi:hypothetical protein
MYQAILRNRLPPGVPTWDAVGANGTNIRVLPLWAAELLHNLTGESLDRCVLLLAVGALFVDVVLLVVLLHQWFDPPLVMAGVLYFGTVLPLTYLFALGVPWDRPSLLFWLAGLLLLRARRLVPLIPILILGVMTKYDILLLPILYFLAQASRSDWKRPLAATAGLLACTFGTYAALRFAIPGGFEPTSIPGQVGRNVEDFLSLGLRYPPLLAFGLPAVLVVVGFKRADRFAQAAVVFAVMQATILFLQANFREVRAEVPVLVLLMPAALIGLRTVMPDALATSPGRMGIGSSDRKERPARFPAEIRVGSLLRGGGVIVDHERSRVDPPLGW